jgi:hypothetical protein
MRLVALGAVLAFFVITIGVLGAYVISERKRRTKGFTAYYSGGPLDGREEQISLPSPPQTIVNDFDIYVHTGAGVYMYQGTAKDENSLLSYNR